MNGRLAAINSLGSVTGVGRSATVNPYWGSTSVSARRRRPRSAHQRTIAALDRNDCRLPALDREFDRNIVPRSVRVGTDFLVRLAGESLELRLRERRVLDVQLHCDAESATEAGGVADREQMFGCGRVGSTGTAHGLGHR